MLGNDSDKPCFVRFQRFLFLSRFLILDLLYFLSSEKSDLLNDEYDNDGSDSGSYGMGYFTLHFDDSVGRDSVLGSGVFFTNRSQVQM